jgi:IMP dehydrogenase/GMP reductase
MSDGSADRYFQDAANNADKFVPEGIEGRVPYKGSMVAILYQLVGGVRGTLGRSLARLLARDLEVRRNLHVAGGPESGTLLWHCVYPVMNRAVSSV